MRREIINPLAGTIFTKEKIRKATLNLGFNKTIKQPHYTLNITLHQDGVHFRTSIARLVYYAFVEPFELSDRSIFISLKDHDGRNIHVSNLVKSNIGVMKKRSFETGRQIISFRSPVTQFDQSGSPIQHYSSIREAQKKTGIHYRGISQAAHGKIHIYKGYFWRFGKHLQKLDLDKIKRRKTNESFIHEELRKKLGIKKVNADKVPPFLNLSIQSMKGERWRDVPGYEGLYQVSDFGRVKALQKITFGQQKWRPEQIKKLTIYPHERAVVGMVKNGKREIKSVPKLVYFVFVKKFDLTDFSFSRPSYKDGNPLNLHYKNIILKRKGVS